MNRRAFLLSATAISGVSIFGSAQSREAIVLTGNLTGSWIKGAGLSSHPFLQSVAGALRPLVCQYNGAILRKSWVVDEQGIDAEGAQWTCRVDQVAVKDVPDALDLRLHFRVHAGQARQAGVALAVDFEGWAKDNYVLVPGAVYDGNRFRIYPASYPPYIQEPAMKPLDMPVTTTNIPHLYPDRRHAKIEGLSGNAATPLMAFYAPSVGRGFVLLTEQATRMGDTGLIIEEAVDRATFIISAPGVREKRYIMAGAAESGDRGVSWSAGDEVTLRARLYNFQASTLQAFFERVSGLRRDLSGPTAYRSLTPASAVVDTMLRHHDATKWSETHQYLTQDHRGVYPWAGILQVGWAGAPAITLPYAIRPTVERVRRVGLTLDRLFRLQAPTGLMYAKWNNKLLGDNHKAIERPNQVLVRRFGETLWFGIYNLEALKRAGYADAVKPAWERALKRLADGLVKLWHTYGQFGQFVDVETGKIDVPGSSCGVVCATGLVLASQYFADPTYLNVAEASAQFYYNRDLSKGYAGGGPREALQAPDSESAHCFVDLYVQLYDLTGKPEYLAYARDAMALLATWEISYDYDFPRLSRMGMAGARSTGAYMANAQNTHGAPCLWLHSGDFMLKLYRATGDKLYAEMSKNLAHNTLQYVTTSENPLILNAAPGSVSERVQINDWEGKDQIGGELPEGDSRLEWECGVLMTLLQNPGLYLRTDTLDLIVYDQIEARVVESDASGVTLELTNTTARNAEVTLFAENAEAAARPMGNFAFTAWPRIRVEAGQTLLQRVTAEGQLMA